MILSDRLAICSWSLRPSAPAELAEQLAAIGIRRTQLALDPIRRGGPWADGIRKLADLGVTVASGMFEAVGEDYSTLDSIKRTGGVVPDATWPRTMANFTEMVPMAQKAGLTHVTFHAGFLPHDRDDPDFEKLSKR